MMELLTKEKVRQIIAKRAAKEFKEGDVVTLGIGYLVNRRVKGDVIMTEEAV